MQVWLTGVEFTDREKSLQSMQPPLYRVMCRMNYFLSREGIHGKFSGEFPGRAVKLHDHHDTDEIKKFRVEIRQELRIITAMFQQEEIEWCLPVVWSDNKDKEVINFLESLRSYGWLSIYLIHSPDYFFNKRAYPKNITFITITTWLALDLPGESPKYEIITRSQAVTNLIKPKKIKTKKNIYRSIFEE